jgi:hypothetical protein
MAWPARGTAASGRSTQRISGAPRLQRVEKRGEIVARHGLVGQEDHGRMGRLVGQKPHPPPTGRGLAHDLDAQRVGPPVELADPHEDTRGQRMGEDAVGDPGGQRFQEVHALGLQRGVDRLDDRVVAEDAVHVVGGLFGAGLDLDHHVEAHGLAHAALGLERADLDLAQVLGHRDAVERRVPRRWPWRVRMDGRRRS